MKKYPPALLPLIFIGALTMISPITYADDEEQVDNIQSEQSYGRKVGEKALSGITNMGTAFLEIPKNIINTTNQSNVAFGFVGGLTKGILNTMGRVTTGFADLITAPIITKPIVRPDRIWDDFDADTTYGPVFRLDNEPDVKMTVLEAPVKEAPRNTISNKERDRLFKEEMRK